MPVVMTGSPGGSLGGNGGSSFGSGLGAVVSSPGKQFTPALETWVRRSEEDQQMITQRKKEYQELRDARLEMISVQAEKTSTKKLKEKKSFEERQAARLAAEEAERQRAKEYRQEALEKPTLGSSKPPWDGLHESSVIPVNTLSCPVHWVYPTVKKHPEALGAGSVAAVNMDAMSRLPPNSDMETVQKYVDNIAANSYELRRKASDVRQQHDAEIQEKADKEKDERVAEAKALREEQMKKAEAAKAAALARSKQIKKEMAEATYKDAKAQAERDRVRYEKSMADRAKNVERLLMDTKLRDDIEIANERPEGSSMSKGGKAEFIEQVKAGTYDE